MKKIIVALIVFACLFASAPHAKAEGSAFCQILDLIANGSGYPSCSQFQLATKLIDCLSTNGDVGYCTDTYGFELGGVDIQKLGDLYTAVDEKDYVKILELIVDIAGEDAPCMVLTILNIPGAGQLCDLMKALYDLAKDIGQALLAVINALGDILEGIYCLFADCDDDKQAKLLASCWKENFEMWVCNGAGARGEPDNAFDQTVNRLTTVANETYNCHPTLMGSCPMHATDPFFDYLVCVKPRMSCYDSLKGYGSEQSAPFDACCPNPSPRYGGQAVTDARNQFLSLVANEWSLWILQTIYPRLMVERNKYAENGDKISAAAHSYVQNRDKKNVVDAITDFCEHDFTDISGSERSSAEDADKAAYDKCMERHRTVDYGLAYRPTYGQVDLWKEASAVGGFMSGLSAESGSTSVDTAALLSNRDWCQKEFYGKQKDTFDQLIYSELRMNATQYCPQKEAGKDLVCSTWENYKSCYDTMAAIGKQSICGIDMKNVGEDISKLVDKKFSDAQSKFPCKHTAYANKAADYVCERPTHLGYCNKFYKEIIGQYKLPENVAALLTCSVQPTKQYSELRDQVDSAVGNLNKAFSSAGFSQCYDANFYGKAFKTAAQEKLYDPLVVFNLSGMTTDDVKKIMQKGVAVKKGQTTQSAPVAKLGKGIPSEPMKSASALNTGTSNKAVTAKPGSPIPSEPSPKAVNPSTICYSLDPCFENFNTPPSNSHCFEFNDSIQQTIDGVITPVIGNLAPISTPGKKAKTFVSNKAQVQKIAESGDLKQELQEEAMEPLVGHGDTGDFGGAGGKKPEAKTQLLAGSQAMVAKTTTASKGTPAAAAQGQKQTQLAGLTLLPDISCTDQPKIAGAPAFWSTTVTLDSGKAVSKSNGLCSFQIEYAVRNTGKAPAASFRGLWTNGAVSGNWPQTFASIAPGGMNSQKIVLPLKPGMNQLLLTLDDLRQVNECDETNNQFRLVVNVTGSCDSGCSTCGGAPTQQPQKIVPKPLRSAPLPLR